MSKIPKRQYHGERRTRAASQNRERILAVSLMQFSKLGIDGTTVESIAEMAEVSVPLVYYLFKSKSGIIHAILQDAILGSDVRDLANLLATESDPARILQGTARICRTIYENENRRIGFLRGAAVYSKDLAKVEQDFDEKRFKMQRSRLHLIFKMKANKPHLKLQKARELVWMYTSRDIYRMLVTEKKWSPAEFEVWLSETLCNALLK